MGVRSFESHKEYREFRNRTNKYQKIARAKNDNLHTKKYEKTKNGFLMRLYRNMKSRVTGVQAAKFHLYAGKELLEKEVFYEWAKQSKKFHSLFRVWESSGYKRTLAPSVDRINSELGYKIENMRWVTMSENCKNIRR
jgi:hypothetical protein